MFLLFIIFLIFYYYIYIYIFCPPQNLHQGGEREAALRAAAGSGVPPEVVQLLRTPAIWQLLPEVPGASPNEPTNEEERTARVANFFVAAVTDLDVHPGASAAV